MDEWRDIIRPEIADLAPEGVTIDNPAIELLTGLLSGRLRKNGWSIGDCKRGFERRRHPAIAAKLAQLNIKMIACVGDLKDGEVLSTHRSIGLGLDLALKDMELDLEVAFIYGILKLCTLGKMLAAIITGDQLLALLQNGTPSGALKRAYDVNAPHNKN